MSGKVITSSSVGSNTGLDGTTTQPEVTSSGTPPATSDGVPSVSTSSTTVAAATRPSAVYDAKTEDEKLARLIYENQAAGLTGVETTTPSSARGIDRLSATGRTVILTDVLNNVISELDATVKVFNVKAFGAVGDGVTDDTAAIQAAEAAAYAAGAGIVDFPVPSVGYLITAPITFHSRIVFRGHSKGFSAGSRIVVSGAIAGFKSYAPGSVVRDVAFEDLTIDNATAAAASKYAIDLLGVSFFRVRNVSGRNHFAGLRMGEGGGGSGYYAEVEGCEWASCTYGERLEASANAIRIVGGRRQGCTVAGTYATNCTGNLIDVTCEACGTGVILDTGTTGTEVNGYFEGNADGAVWCLSGSSRNTIRPRLLSNGSDYVRNSGAATNVFRSGNGQPAFPAMEGGYGSGSQLITWGGLNVDSNADGLADGLVMSPSVPAGTSLALDSGTRRMSSACQRYGWNATSSRRIEGTVPTVVGQTYTFHGYARTTLDGVMRLFAGESTINHTTYSGPIILGNPPSEINQWEHFSFTFVATSTAMACGLELVNPGGIGFAWMADWKLEVGVTPTTFDASADGNTIGDPLTSGATIAPTHRIHKVSGAATISTITPPPGFAGDIILIPTGAWSTDLAGNIANAITAVANVPVVAVYDPSAGKWYVR